MGFSRLGGAPPPRAEIKEMIKNIKKGDRHIVNELIAHPKKTSDPLKSDPVPILP